MYKLSGLDGNPVYKLSGLGGNPVYKLSGLGGNLVYKLSGVGGKNRLLTVMLKFYINSFKNLIIWNPKAIGCYP